MKSHTKWRLVRVVITTSYLLAGWVLFTGSLELGSILIGASASLCVAALTYDVFIVEDEAGWRALLPRLHWVGAYLLLLVSRLYLASFAMLFSMVTRRFNPGVVHFRTRLRSDIARSVLATSVTMTPGTVALELDDDHLVVHWFNARTTHARHAGELIKGGFEAVLRRVWG